MEMGAAAFDEGVATLLASYRAIGPQATVRLAKKTSTSSGRGPRTRTPVSTSPASTG